MTLPELIQKTLTMQSSITFIEGKRGLGKTDFAFKIAEEAVLTYHLIEHVASNVKVFQNSPVPVTRIIDTDTLESWALEVKGKKICILDEMGKAIRRRRFSSNLNIKLMDTFQVIRKYDLHLVLIAPHYRFIDSILEDTDILDLHITKKSQKVALLRKPYWRFARRFIDIKPTNIPFDTRDIAPFFEHNPLKKEKMDSLPYEIQIAVRYGVKKESMDSIGNTEKKNRKEVSRIVQKGIQEMYQIVSCVKPNARGDNQPQQVTPSAEKDISFPINNIIGNNTNKSDVKCPSLTTPTEGQKEH